MHSFSSLTALVALLAAATSAAPSQTINKRAVTVEAKRNPQFNPMKRDVPAALRKAYRKYGIQMPAQLNARQTNSTGNENGVANTTPEPNLSEFLTPVNVGGQMMNLDFDTGSSDLWVFSTQLSQSAIGQHAAFNPAKSQAFAPMQGATYLITYGDGSGSAGTVGTDNVAVGSATATKQAVEVATAISQSFVQDMDNDGLLGLAFSKLNTVKPTAQKTFFDTIMPNLQMPVFAADLRANASGTYQFGQIDMTKAKGQLTNVPVNNSQGFWQITSNFVEIGGQRMNVQNANPAIADTGTSLLLVDPPVASAYYSKVQGATNDPNAGGFTYACSTTPPDIGVAMGDNYVATIPGNMVTFAEVSPGQCFGGVQSNQGSNLQIYGDTMFKTQYVVFDGTPNAPQLMVAPKA